MDGAVRSCFTGGMTTYRLAVIPGDGIGTEVTPAALSVLAAATAGTDLRFTIEEFDWSCRRYLDHGAMMPEDGIDRLGEFDAILLGAVGAPDVPDHVSLWGLLIPIRRAFEQYVNLRPVRLFEGVTSPLRPELARDVDVVIVRENTEGEYSRVGGRLYEGFATEVAMQESVFTRTGVTRIVDYAFDLASRRGGGLTSATKSNGIVHTMPFWDQIVAERAKFHEVVWRSEHIDALCAKLVMNPAAFDVIVGSNLFGDILSDLTAAVAGSIGIAPSANLNPEGTFPSMFEPVHGSAPDIAGRGVANPIGAIWSTAMMVDHLGHPEVAERIMTGVATSLATPATRTADLSGTGDTRGVTEAVVAGLG